MNAQTTFTVDDRLIKLPEVMQIVGLGKTMIYRKVRQHSFPQPFKPTGGSTRWSEREVREWIQDVASRRSA